jgi:8-amino-7-oxononanoate synthase
LNHAEAWAQEDLNLIEQNGLLRTLEPRSNPQGPLIQLGQESLINFSSNDYLGLSSHPEIQLAVSNSLSQFGFGSGASRLVVGDTDLHHQLETQLALIDGSESALLFNSGYAANTGIISSLVDSRDAVFSDELNHASIVDGCRLSKSKIHVYRHNDVNHLQSLLRESTARRKLVVTDAVFSMDGDLAPVVEIKKACDTFGAALMVDEAHSTGIFSQHGEGLCFKLGVKPDIKMGTLSKSLGCFGAWAACKKSVRTLLLNRVRPLIFSTSLPPAVCAAGIAAVKLMKNGTHLREALWKNIEQLKVGLSTLGFQTSGTSAIFSVVLGSNESAMKASYSLRNQGFLVKAIRPPTVPEGTSRLRIAVTSAHSTLHIDGLLRALKGER